MKILIAISDSFCTNFIRGQGKFLVEKGHEVIIISGPGEEIDRLEVDEPIKVIRVNFSREISVWNDLKTLFTIIKIIHKEKPDIINAGNPKPGFIFALAKLFFFKTPLVFTLRGVRSDTLNGIKKQLVKATEKITCLFADKIIAISPSLKEHAYSIGLFNNKDKCVVLGKGSSNGYDINYFSNNFEIRQRGNLLLQEFSIPSDSFKLLFVGRVTKDKGVQELLDALKICWNTNVDIHLIIAGRIEKDDPLPDDYYKMIKNHSKIHFLGKQLDIRPVYSIGNALVLYSYREGFGNVVIEASCFNLPTIVADIPGLRDTTEHFYSGLTVSPKNANELAKAIMWLYNNKESAKELGENGRERAVNFFGNHVIWSKQLELYEEILNKNN